MDTHHQQSETSASTAVVTELKSRLEDFEFGAEVTGCEREKLRNDFYLFQWLKKTNLNVDKAEAAIRKSFLWREKNNISTIVQDFPKDAAKNFPIYMNYVSHAGTPVGAFPADPPWDMRGFIESAPDGGDKFIRYCGLMTLATENIWLQHNLKLLSRDERKSYTDTPENWSFIWNTIRSILPQARSPRTVRCIIQVILDIGAYFPPMVEKVIFINVATAASIVLRMIRPYFTFTRLEVHDRNETKWKKALSEFMRLDQLRPELGGPEEPINAQSGGAGDCASLLNSLCIKN